MLSLLPGFGPEAGASPWQPSSAHSPASSASTAMTPVPWQATYSERAAALVLPAHEIMQTPFQGAPHRTGSLQLNASKGVGTLLEILGIVLERHAQSGVEQRLPAHPCQLLHLSACPESTSCRARVSYDTRLGVFCMQAGGGC